MANTPGIVRPLKLHVDLLLVRFDSLLLVWRTTTTMGPQASTSLDLYRKYPRDCMPIENARRFAVGSIRFTVGGMADQDYHPRC
jgi:hypothetical protein